MEDSTHTGALLVVGAGPGVGMAVARRFGGVPVGLIARDEVRLRAMTETLRLEGRTVASAAADASDPTALRAAIGRIIAELGGIDTACFSPLPPVATIKRAAATDAEDLLTALALVVGGAATTVRAVLPGMLARGSGRLLFTTGSGALHPSPERASPAVYTAAQTAYIDVLRRDLSGRGVAVAHVAVVGPVGADGHRPEDVADALHDLADEGGSTVLHLTEGAR
ncbi:SDR family NAD(P)-dependent oxidoreductase [Amnibacterium setariae]|uniref:SDR family oxidoreductase n=1 Tax=Amnibacterium setariae TaxID=2306585 RepID=A0A3A1TWM1_9MICO|nr:SDR family oxidoreductase [Amnibacterium setariae]RIX28633.1 SDR family oxidoreductase [Amnibacterium setariae]